MLGVTRSPAAMGRISMMVSGETRADTKPTFPARESLEPQELQAEYITVKADGLLKVLGVHHHMVQSPHMHCFLPRAFPARLVSSGAYRSGLSQRSLLQAQLGDDRIVCCLAR